MTTTTSSGSNVQDVLARYTERMNRLIDDKEEAMELIRDLKTEIKSAGFDVAAFTRNVRWARRQEAWEHEKAVRDSEALYAPHMGVPIND